jgi:SAM-dependent methyltransferase
VRRGGVRVGRAEVTAVPDPQEFRRRSLEQWEASAEGWAERRAQFQRSALPVSRWLVEAIRPQPGHRVLELACGPGDTGLLAAELVQPGGEVVLSDFAEAMVDVARIRIDELGLTASVQAKVIDAEWIDEPTASFDGVLCRWGFMLVADPLAALREARRVLKPGGRLALAAWTSADENPWNALGGRELVRRGHLERPEPGAPGPFAWAQPGLIAELLQEAGFVDPDVQALAFTQRYEDMDDWWQALRALGRAFRDATDALDPEERYAVRTALAEQVAPYEQPDGTLAFPARTWVAAADA